MKLSIITINRNNADGLSRTIESVLSQSARDSFEYIVIDGASVDGSVDIIRNRSEKIDKWVSEKDTGIYNAMNKGVSMSTGDYCLFLNSGDTLHDDTTIQNILSNLGDKQIITGKIVFTNDQNLMYADEPLTLGFFYNRSLPHPATFIKRSLLIDTPYDESLKIVSDWKFFVQVIVQQNVSYRFINQLITDFEPDGISGRNRDLALNEKRQVLSEIFPERILADYIHFFEGEGYQNTSYDNFYIKLRNYKYGSLLYSVNVLILRILSIFRKGARFSRSFPLKPNHHEGII